MKAFWYWNCCAKGFFWEIIIVEKTCLTKMATKLINWVFLLNEKELGKVVQKFNFREGHTSSTFSNSSSFLRYAFLGLKFTFQNNDFWEKSFYYSSFYTKKLSFGHWSTIFWENRPTLMWHQMQGIMLCPVSSQDTPKNWKDSPETPQKYA